MHVRKGDKVLVITGNDKGRTGKVLKVFRDGNRAVVEGIRIIKRHTRPSQKNQQGGIVEKEAPIHISNLQVVCPDCGKASGMSRIRDEEGRLKRRCKACGEIITAV